MPWFGRKQEEQVARRLYEGIVARARSPVFYSTLGVPDSLDGRFEMVALHLCLVLRRLKAASPKLDLLEQSLFDLFMLDKDQSLREMGAGDLGVGKKVKRMATAVYGRIKAYNDGLAQEPPTLQEGEDSLVWALARNLYGTIEPPAHCLPIMAAYVRSQAVFLDSQDDLEFAKGNLVFAPLPASE